MNRFQILFLGGSAFLSSLASSQAAVISLYSAVGPVAVVNGAPQYAVIDNPLAAGGAVSDTAGSLFFATTLVRSDNNNFTTLGIYANADGSSGNGAVDMGRNNANVPFSVFDYLDNKAGNSAAARAGDGSPIVNINTGTYQMIGEIEFTSATTGIIRGWVLNGSIGSLDLNAPNITTTFNSGFNGSADLYLKMNTGTNATFSNTSVNWAETSADRAVAFTAVGGAIPEPSAAMIAALGALGLARRKRSAR